MPVRFRGADFQRAGRGGGEEGCAEEEGFGALGEGREGGGGGMEGGGEGVRGWCYWWAAGGGRRGGHGGGGGSVVAREVVGTVGGLMWVIVGCNVAMGFELLSACAWC